MQIRGVIKTVTFHNPDTGYSVLKILQKDSQSATAVVGVFPKLKEGEWLEIQGEWVQHSKFGKQLKSESYKVITPEDKDHIEKYLGSGILKGVGPSQAKLLVDKFGEETFEVLDHHPERLNEISSLGPKKRENIVNRWMENRSIRKVMYFLQSHDIGLNIGAKIYHQYGATAVETLKANPYLLAQDIWGVGFFKADFIAQKLGFDLESYERIKAGLIYSINQSASDGHVYLTKEELIHNCASLLKVPKELMVYTLDNLVDNTDIYRDTNDFYYRPYLYHSEMGISRKLLELTNQKITTKSPLIHSGIEKAQNFLSEKFKMDFSYLPEQKQAIQRAVQSGIFLLTGGPGTGKTTSLLGILRIFQEHQLNIKLTAPTGRAAKRMQEVCGVSAFTIHRLLQYEPESRAFVHNEKNPLSAEVVIVDEVSMIDTVLMYSLLRAIKKGTRLVFLGDPDQLPSVGPGKVLSEMIKSQSIPHTHLKQIMRQEESSPIVGNAHKVVRGETPDLTPSDLFQFFTFHSPNKATEKTVELYTETLPKKFGFDPQMDIQILTPMNKGTLGTFSLNQTIQSVFNKNTAKLDYKEFSFKKGDKVMQIKNNYDKNVYNGDIGRVFNIDLQEKTLTVQFDDLIIYQWEELDQLNLAYAVTIHKSQGSEFKAVILLLDNQHHLLLQRNLLYTAMTRAKNHLYIIGSNYALKKAVENNPIVKRNTQLAEHLQHKPLSEFEFMNFDSQSEFNAS